MKTINVVQKESVISVTLNRPDVRNAFHPSMIEELTQTFSAIHKNKTARIVLFSGEGRSFCAGADLEWMKSMAKFTKQQNRKDAEKLFKMFQTIHECKAIVITKAHGHVMGGGLGLLAVSDLVVAEEKTEFCFSEVKMGLSPAVISAFVKNKVSLSQMQEWFLTAGVFNADQAKAMGLVNSVATIEKLDSVIDQWQKSLLANGPRALQETKKLLRAVAGESSGSRLKKITTQLIAQLRVSEEGQEGLQSFFNKQTPKWR